VTDSREFRDLGFRCGLEIHQQLLTRRKLFCRCPAGIRHEEPDGRILRHMRPTLSEMGEYDGTALMEFKTKKNVTYELFRNGTCTYEMDDTPPFPLNREALEIALEIALLLNCNVVDEVHITRKQYLDGSIPTGFQRTAIVGLDGWIPFKGRRIGVAQLTLEEDACREISDRGHEIVFRTDRLSTPLVEITTCADMRDPREAAEVNEELGRLLRVSGKVRRGIGATRQDVNVSITGGTRVEIKGVPRFRAVERLTAVEAHRQRVLLEMAEALKPRDRSSLVAARAGLDEALAFSEAPALSEAREKGWSVGGIRLRAFADALATEVQPGVTFAREIEGRVRVIACLDERPILLHSAAPEAGGLGTREWEAIQAELGGADARDAYLVVRGPATDVETALEEIAIRAGEAWEGVPSETRQALADGTTDFERILPGPDRMYPDTDAEPVAVSREHIVEIQRALPERPWERESRLREAGVPEGLARRLALSPRYGLARTLVEEGALPPAHLAWALADYLVGLRRRGLPVDETPDERLLEVLRRVARAGRPELLGEALRRAATGEELPEEAPPAEEVGRVVGSAVDEAAGLEFADNGARLRWVAGRARTLLGGVAAPGPELARQAERALAAGA
jgi:glutamyl-tRNA(Gln) amidotransferase subunit E